MSQSSLPTQTPHASPAHSAVVEDPASGTVDVEAGEKVSTVEPGAEAAATTPDPVELSMRARRKRVGARRVVS